MKIVAIGGDPGSGKSTLMKRWMIPLGCWEKQYKDVKLVPYLWQSEWNFYVLGKYDEGETFSGTDKMSMAVQPEAVKFLQQLRNTEATLLFEGDRLFTASFLEACVDTCETLILRLQVDKTERERRYELRGSNQNATWLAGRESKISNICANMVLQENIEVMKNNTEEDQKLVIAHINRFTGVQNGL